MQVDVARGEIMPRAILIMGVSGSGKSTLAALLAATLHCPYLEGDAFHSAENIEKMRAGKPLQDEDRWPWLDCLGAAAASSITANGLVVLTCSALKRSYRERLRRTIQNSVSFVLLTANREELARRLSDRSNHYMPASLLTSQLAALERPEDDEGAIVLDAREPPARLCAAAIAWLANPAARGTNPGVPLPF